MLIISAIRFNDIPKSGNINYFGKKLDFASKLLYLYTKINL